MTGPQAGKFHAGLGMTGMYHDAVSHVNTNVRGPGPVSVEKHQVARAQLLDGVWGDHEFVEERTVDVHMRRLRKALEASGHDARIETVRGTGYRFNAAA